MTNLRPLNDVIGVGVGRAGPVLAGPPFRDLLIFIIGVQERAMNGVGTQAVTFYASSNCTCPQNYTRSWIPRARCQT